MDEPNLSCFSHNLPTGTDDHLIEWGAAGIALPGQSVSGDRYVVASHGDGVLVAVMDGLGHGDEAAKASEIAAAVLVAHASESCSSLFTLCNQALARTRGVVMSAAQFGRHDHTLTWVGVGNVEGFVLRADPQRHPAHEHILLRGGIVGYQMPPLRVSSLPVARGDLLVLVTDGLRSGFENECSFAEGPQQIADQILRCCWRGSDDAQVFVARYWGGAQ
jgi:phosphoserine phosphatase RsbX